VQAGRGHRSNILAILQNGRLLFFVEHEDATATREKVEWQTEQVDRGSQEGHVTATDFGIRIIDDLFDYIVGFLVVVRFSVSTTVLDGLCAIGRLLKEVRKKSSVKGAMFY
jgi:hypothetical protein